MRLVNADALAMKLRHMGYMDENEEVQEVIDRFAEECDGDLISRQAAIDELEDFWHEVKQRHKITIGEMALYCSCRGIVKDLPSAEPERKTGKWLYDKYYLVHVCSECDEQALEEYTVNPRTLDRDYDEVLSDYCPHCGSRMLEIEDDEEEEEEDE